MNTTSIIKGVEPCKIYTYEYDSCNYQMHKVTKHNARQVELILTRCNLLVDGNSFPEPVDWHQYFEYSYLVLYATFSVATIVCKKSSNELVIEAIAILDQFRNIGLGKFMLSSVLKSIKSDVHAVSTNTECCCEDIQHLYKNYGFEADGKGVFVKIISAERPAGASENNS